MNFVLKLPGRSLPHETTGTGDWDVSFVPPEITRLMRPPEKLIRMLEGERDATR